MAMRCCRAASPLPMPILRGDVRAAGCGPASGRMPAQRGRCTLQLERRWINLAVAPDAERADFSAQPPSEWLVENMPFTNADFSFSAAGADADAARHLGARPGAALFVAERITWLGEASITFARMTFCEGYRMVTRI